MTTSLRPVNVTPFSIDNLSCTQRTRLICVLSDYISSDSPDLKNTLESIDPACLLGVSLSGRLALFLSVASHESIASLLVRLARSV